MVISKYSLLALVILAGLSACKSEFEKIRTSNDPESMYKSAVEYFEKGEYSKTQTLFESIVSSYRGKKEFEQLNYMFAYTYYHQKDYTAAASAFKNFANTFVYSPLKEEMELIRKAKTKDLISAKVIKYSLKAYRIPYTYSVVVKAPVKLPTM